MRRNSAHNRSISFWASSRYMADESDEARTLNCYREPSVVDFTPLRNCKTIGIDGDSGAGKTTLARELQSALGGEVISLDCFLNDFIPGNGAPPSYVSQINKALLSERLNRATLKPLIVEGILLLDVLATVNIRPDYLIFAKCKHEGQWQYEQYLRSPTIQPASQFTREIANYYRIRRPFEQSQLQTTLQKSLRRES